MTHCCEMMKEQIDQTCEKHDPFECPDSVMVSTSNGYGLPIHDGGSSFIEISYCPWCGTEFDTSPLSQVDKALGS